MAKEKKENNEIVTIKQLYPPSSIIYPLSFPEKKNYALNLSVKVFNLAQNT